MATFDLFDGIGSPARVVVRVEGKCDGRVYGIVDALVETGVGDRGWSEWHRGLAWFELDTDPQAVEREAERLADQDAETYEVVRLVAEGRCELKGRDDLVREFVDSAKRVWPIAREQ